MTDEENPELSEADVAGMVPARDVLPASVYQTLVAGEPKGPVTDWATDRKPAQVTLNVKVDPDTLATYKATGPGWQARVSADLDKGAAKLRKRA